MKRLKIVFGKEQVLKLYTNQELSEREISENVRYYDFSTEMEKIAFIKGIEESLGWNAYCIPDFEINTSKINCP
jgi:hypothetical protein